MKDKIIYLIQISLGRVGGVLASLFAMKFIISTHGADVWGSIIFLLSLLNLASILTLFGQGNYLLSLSSEVVSERIGKIIVNVIELSLIIAVCFLLFNVIFDIWSQSLASYIAISIPLYSLAKISRRFYQKNDNRFVFNILNSDNFIYYALIIFVGLEILIAVEVDYLLVILVTVAIAAIGVSLYFAGNINWQSVNISNLGVLKESSAFLLGSSLLLLMGWIDTFLLGLIKGEKEVGLYNVIFKLASIATFVLSLTNAIIAPRMKDLYRENFPYFKKLIKITNRFNVVITFFALLTALLFLTQILTFFGVSEESQQLLEIPAFILLIAYSINSACGNVGYILQMTGKVKQFNKIVSVAAVINLTLNVILIPMYGILGATIATGFSMIVWNISSAVYIKKSMNFLTI